MLNCKFCSKECKNDNSLRNHERLCKLNPNRDSSSIYIAKKASEKKHNCIHCGELFAKANLKKHENSCVSNPKNKKECPVCSTLFSGNAKTCSYSCSNKYFRTGEKNGNWKGTRYRTIVKEFHEMKCIICGEDKIISVHHYDENHTNNNPNNLIPLCPTHHQYVHSRYKYLIIDKIEEYRKSLPFA